MGALQVEAVPAAGASVEVAQQRPVSARERNGRGDRTPPRREDQGDKVRRLRVVAAQEAPRFWICPTGSCGGRLPPAAATVPCGRDHPAPSRCLRLGPQTVVGGQLRKRTSLRPCRPATNARNGPGIPGPRRRRGTKTWDERTTRNPTLLLRLSGGCCCGRRRERCSHCCSTTRRATRAVRYRGPRDDLRTAGRDLQKKFEPRFARDGSGATRPPAATRQTGIRVRPRWGTNAPPETPH